MKKLFLSMVCLAGFIFTGTAQDIKFGAKAGLNLSTFMGDDADEAEALAGFHVGGLVEIKLNDKFSVQPELLFSRIGAQATVSEVEGGVLYRGDLKARLGYLTVPVMAKYYVIPGLSVEAGPQVGFLVSAKHEVDATADFGVGTVSFGDTDDAKDQYKKVDFAFNLGAGYELPMGLFFQARYNIGLTNIGEAYTDSDGDRVRAADLKNGVFQLSAGWKF